MANDQLFIEGYIHTESKLGISGAKLSINGIKTSTFSDGSFKCLVPVVDIYQIKVRRNYFYPSVHTFSKWELDENQKKILEVPTITLVKKKEREHYLLLAEIP